MSQAVGCEYYSLLYVNHMSQAAGCELLLNTDDSCLIFQNKDITEIETVLNRSASMLCDWLIDNKLSIHFDKDITRSFLF